MADVLLAVNGVGRGHLVRSLRAWSWLRRAGRRPTVFFQGRYPDGLAKRHPGTGMPLLYRMPVATAQILADEVARYALLSTPAVVIEDTHPATVGWPSEVNWFLTVRPTDFVHMRMLDRHNRGHCRRFIVYDAPGSPSWPYTPDETAELLSWEKWTFIGPSFHRPHRQGVASVRARHGIVDERPLFVFSMGGGGERDGSGDRASFIDASVDIGENLRMLFPDARLLWVCGPLYPADQGAPPGFELVREEPELPSLLSLAKGAIIRPGFNMTWECVAAGTPFVPLPGTTYAEPVRDRLDRLADFGIGAPESLDEWRDDAWLTRHAAACRRAMKVCSGAPATRFLRSISEGVEEGTSIPPPAAPPTVNATRFEALTTDIQAAGGEKRLLIRVDDVVEASAEVAWVVALCRERGLFPSLEVIPYLCRFAARSLDAMDPEARCEVSQHGFAHLPQRGPGTARRGEFVHDDPGPSPTSALLLRRGRRLLRAVFGARYKGGYSAPYDALPTWLPGYLRSIDGRFVSWVYAAPRPGTIANVRVDVDPWSWAAGRERPSDIIAAQVRGSLRGGGRVGLVLHPSLLRSVAHRRTMESLIDALVLAGCTGQSLSEAAALGPVAASSTGP